MRTDEELKTFMRNAKIYAERRGYQNDSDDFMIDATIEFEKGRSATISQYFVDYLRKTYGDVRTEIKKLKRQYREMNGSARVNPKEEVLSFYLKHLEVRDRVIFTLLWYGVEQVEIAEVLGLKESRVSQLVSRIKWQLRNLNEEESYEPI